MKELKKTTQDIKKFTTPLGRLVQSCVKRICFLCGCQCMYLQKSGEHLAQGEAPRKACNPKSPNKVAPPTWQCGFLGKGFTRHLQKFLSRWTQLRCTQRTLSLSGDCRRGTFHLHSELGEKVSGTGLGGDKKADYYSKDNNNKGCLCHFQLPTLLWDRLD